MLNYLNELGKLSEGSGSRSEYFAAVPKKVEKIVGLFSDMIPMG